MKGRLDTEILVKGLQAVELLIQESQGIYGFHLNGDLSPWADFFSGGNSEEWLENFEEAIHHINSELSSEQDKISKQ